MAMPDRKLADAQPADGQCRDGHPAEGRRPDRQRADGERLAAFGWQWLAALPICDHVLAPRLRCGPAYTAANMQGTCRIWQRIEGGA
jgi:hypothetical protein